MGKSYSQWVESQVEFELFQIEKQEISVLARGGSYECGHVGLKDNS